MSWHCTACGHSHNGTIHCPRTQSQKILAAYSEYVEPIRCTCAQGFFGMDYDHGTTCALVKAGLRGAAAGVEE